ncbi:hypothetical protein NSERUTF1_2141 [Nocardia seriolae]|nr:hypothetical protein NSERUTF1_2141 [Nocardia seriolae]
MHRGERNDQGCREQDPCGCGAHSEPLGVQQRRHQIHGNANGQNQTDNVLRHSRSTPRWIKPNSAKTATVSTVNTTTSMSRNLSLSSTSQDAPE